MNPDTLKRYQCNRLRVVPEMAYSPHFRDASGRDDAGQGGSYNPRLDLVLLVNGLPTATLELKSEFKQSVENAKRQYATSYLWERLFQPDARLKVLGRFLHLDKKTSEGFDGKPVTREKMIFPRYHQWDVVNKLIEATRAEGPGKRYLIQHSAGSGKSNSIAWVAHQLAALYDAAGQKLFSSVIVITDSTVLDSQLQNTIYQFEHAHGVVRLITRELGNQSKSEQLAEALAEQTRIIIVTIQTFPALFEALDKYPKLASGRYAVIADEAHSSQTGSSASKLKRILGYEKSGSDASGFDNTEREVISAEELLDAAVAARQPNERISYYAFTATPKAKTLELFGRPPQPDLPPSADIRSLLNGQAKAMVVTSSRQEAVRYQLAMKEYVKQLGYTDVHPLVAFSGSGLPDGVIPEEVTEASSMLNAGLNGCDLAAKPSTPRISTC